MKHNFLRKGKKNSGDAPALDWPRVFRPANMYNPSAVHIEHNKELHNLQVFYRQFDIIYFSAKNL